MSANPSLRHISFGMCRLDEVRLKLVGPGFKMRRNRKFAMAGPLAHPGTSAIHRPQGFIHFLRLGFLEMARNKR